MEIPRLKASIISGLYIDVEKSEENLKNKKNRKGN
jgi:hypothetical protein